MPSDKHCCVPGCKEPGGMSQILHGFPNPEKDKERFLAWVHAIGGDILGLTNEHIYKYRRVCHLHFEEKYKCRFSRISNLAVPRLNIPDLLSSERKLSFLETKPMQELSNLTNPSSSKGLGSLQLSAHTLSMATAIEEHLPKENVDTCVLEHKPVSPSNIPVFIESVQQKDDTCVLEQKQTVFRVMVMTVFQRTYNLTLKC